MEIAGLQASGCTRLLSDLRILSLERSLNRASDRLRSILRQLSRRALLFTRFVSPSCLLAFAFRVNRSGDTKYRNCGGIRSCGFCKFASISRADTFTSFTKCLLTFGLSSNRLTVRYLVAMSSGTIKLSIVHSMSTRLLRHFSLYTLFNLIDFLTVISVCEFFY